MKLNELKNQLQTKKIIIVLTSTIITALIALLIIHISSNPVKIGEISNIKINSFKGTKLNIEILIPIENKSYLNYEIKNINLEVSVNNEKLGKITKTQDIIITARTNKIQTINAEITLCNVFSGLLSIMKQLKDSDVNITIDGDITVKSLFMSKKIVIQREKKIKIT